MASKVYKIPFPTAYSIKLCDENGDAIIGFNLGKPLQDGDTLNLELKYEFDPRGKLVLEAK